MVDGTRAESEMGCHPSLPAPAVLRMVSPQAGPPGTRLSLRGSPGWRMQQSCQPPNYGDNDCIGAILVGDYVCTLPTPSDAEAVISWSSGNRYGSEYIVSCNLQEPGPVRNGEKPHLHGKHGTTVPQA